MIDISWSMFIPFTTKKMGQFSVHQPGQIFANALSDLYSNHLKNSIRLLGKRVENAAIEEIYVAPLFNEVLKNQGFLPHLSTLNLCSPVLKRLKEMGFEIDAFYYPFENNAPEKQFILGCRKYFPNSKIIGFQHTTFFPNQLAYQLGPDEKEYHPLPDKIVCRGPIYVKLHNGAGFPSEILVAGPNLRFESVYIEKAEVKNSGGNKKKMLLLPLTFSYDLAFQLFVKTGEALKDILDYQVYIRGHPLLPKKNLIDFLNKIGMNNYEFADEGIIQDWLPKMYAVISAGISITILEAVVSGVPVIRMIPDNTVFYDPFIGPDYPLKPVSTAAGIRKQLQLVGDLIRDDNDIFQRIGKKVLSEYFTQPSEENLSVFL